MDKTPKSVKADPFDYIRTTYKVPAGMGIRVRWGAEQREGTITGVEDPYVLVKLDGDRHARPYHPTWMMTYLEQQT